MSQLNSKVIRISNEVTFHFLSIHDYNDNIKNIINENLVAICDGILSDTELSLVKKQLLIWFDGKDESKKIGFIAEFFCHLYMKQLNYKQHFLFKNLEENNSMKKGFDGLYQYEDEIWLYESKSSLPTTLTAKHNSNIGEAFRDISKKISGQKKDKKGNPIDPWDNAINHASMININPDLSLLKNLRNFKKRFYDNEYEKIDNFNVIPSSTIYLGDRWEEINSNELQLNLEKLLKKYNFKKMNVICLNKKSVDEFINFLNT
jgi:hypothetical protein